MTQGRLIRRSRKRCRKTPFPPLESPPEKRTFIPFFQLNPFIGLIGNVIPENPEDQILPQVPLENPEDQILPQEPPPSQHDEDMNTDTGGDGNCEGPSDPEEHFGGDVDPPIPVDTYLGVDLPFIVPNWLVLWAMYLSTGTDATTETQFNIVRRLLSTAFQSAQINWRSDELEFVSAPQVVLYRNRAAFPSYTTIWKTTRPSVLRHAALPTFLTALPVIQGTSGAFTARDPDVPVETLQSSINLPSSYFSHWTR